jgi:hypothetical protein
MCEFIPPTREVALNNKQVNTKISMSLLEIDPTVWELLIEGGLTNTTN